MSDARWSQVKALFREASERDSASRQTFLDERCTDADVRAEVERLLTLDDGATSGFLASPLDPSTNPTDAATDPCLGRRIGAFVIRSRIGAGGMGAVYAAEQDQPRRTVAIKIMRPGLATPATLRRFQHEAELLGRLQHPGIAQILEAGTFDLGEGAQPYIAMEFVEGRPLLEHADTAGLDDRQRLLLLTRVCDAVHHAHQKGVIHRDLKPANILVTHRVISLTDSSASGTTGGIGQPKILDFGVARATDPQRQVTTVTTAGELIGTLRYMSPEQVRGHPDEVDTRSDVYALGVIGYQLLTGEMPHDFHDCSIPECIRRIEEDVPRPLSAHRRDLRGDLDTIFAKALDKDRDQRYNSAAELAADVHRLLLDEPITARPHTTVYQIRKFARRHRGLVAGVIAAFIILLAGIATTGWQAIRAARHADAADHEARRAHAVTDFLKRIFAFADPLAGGASVNLRDLVDNAEREIPHLFHDMPLGEADVRNELGTIYLALGTNDEASRQFNLAHSIWQRHHGDQHEDSLKGLANRGLVALTIGNSEAALPMLQDAYDRRAALLGPDAEPTINTQINLAMALDAQGDPAAAERIMRDAVRRQETRGRPTVDSITTQANLVILLRRQNRLDEALALSEKTLATAKQALGEDHARTLLCMSNHARTLRLLDRHDESLDLYQQAVGGLEEKFGPHHHDVLTARMNYAQLLLRTEDYPGAAAEFIAAADAWNDRYGGSHALQFRAARGAALALQNLDDLPQAEQRWRETLAGYRRHYGDATERTLETIDDLADVLDRQGRRAETLDLRLERRDAAEPVYGRGDIRTVRSIRDVARVLVAMGRVDEAGAEYDRAIKLAQETLGADHRETVRLLEAKSEIPADSERR